MSGSASTEPLHMKVHRGLVCRRVHGPMGTFWFSSEGGWFAL